ncbi:MAG TPA: outer membrane lipoprotein-sorting protein [Opitutaceae bacterium]|jgi:hypothetical protein|nr:outer membrane lipoprotein-sorting protein [Opitutaceae bacterium]
MRGPGKILPLLLGFALAASAQQRFLPQPSYVQLNPPDQAEGRHILEEFRAKGITGDYFLEFELHVLPRRGDEHVLTGQFWGTRNDQGPLSRVEVVTTAGKPELRLLVQNGPAPAVWSWNGTGPAQPLDTAAFFAPVGNTNLTAFDLQMPFLYWPDFVYEGLTRLRGRPTHQFLLRPPKDFADRYPALTGVRAYLDSQFTALVQAELVGDHGQLLKTISLLELKRIGEQWIPKTFDVRDEVTRDKTRFVVTGAALGLSLSKDMFAPAQLSEAVKPPDAKRIVPVE